MQLTYRFWHELDTAQQTLVSARYGAVAPWLAAPRGRPTMVLTAWADGALQGFSLLTHDRVSVGAAVVDVAVIRRLVQQTPEPAALVEHAMTHAATAFDEGLGILLVHGAVDTWATYGFAPVSYPVTTTWSQRPPTRQPEPGTVTVGVPDPATLNAIVDIARARRSPAVAVLERIDPDQPQWLCLRSRNGELRAAARIDRTSTAAHVVIGRAVVVDDGAALDLVDALWAQPGIVSLTLTIAADHPAARMALFSGATTQISAAAPSGVLAGIIDLPTMLGALIPAFQARLAASVYHDWVGGVRLEISDERAMVMLDHGKVSVIDGTREAQVRLRNIELPALAHLCFGYRSVSALRRVGLLQCDDTELPLLEILFPVLAPTIDWES